MFYEPAKENHNLKQNPIKSLVVPRPIAWVYTENNLAPFSYFNLVSDSPAMLMFSIAHNVKGRLKDTLVNIKNNKYFTVNMVPHELAEQMLVTSDYFEYGINEAEIAKVKLEKCRLIDSKIVADSPISLECERYSFIELPADSKGHFCTIVIGNIMGIHIKDNLILDGKIDITKAEIISRLGYKYYSKLDNKFEIERK